MLDQESSLRLTVLRFPLIIGVVFIHAYASTVGLAGGEIGVSQPSLLADFIRNFISQGIARISVPLFFLMSGYLFFQGFVWSKEGFLIKLKRRVRTLLIPFLFWNIATLLVIALAQAIPATQSFFSGKNPLIASFHIFDYLNAIIGINRSPIAYQFWFIRDLIVLVFLVPLLYIGNKYVPIPFLGILFLNWLLGGWSIFGPSSDALLFFSFGAYIGSTSRNLFYFDKFGGIVVGLYLFIITIESLFSNLPFIPYLHQIGILFGLIGALYATKFIPKNERLKSYLVHLSEVSFFLFAST